MFGKRKPSVHQLIEEALAKQAEALRLEAEKNRQPTEEEKIKEGIVKRALELAEQTYRKDVMFRTLQESEFTYAIMTDLMQAAKLTGRVTITFKTGTEVVIENLDRYPDNPREALEKLYGSQLV